MCHDKFVQTTNASKALFPLPYDIVQYRGKNTRITHPLEATTFSLTPSARHRERRPPLVKQICPLSEHKLFWTRKIKLSSDKRHDPMDIGTKEESEGHLIVVFQCLENVVVIVHVLPKTIRKSERGRGVRQEVQRTSSFIGSPRRNAFSSLFLISFILISSGPEILGLDRPTANIRQVGSISLVRGPPPHPDELPFLPGPGWTVASSELTLQHVYATLTLVVCDAPS